MPVASAINLIGINTEFLIILGAIVNAIFLPLTVAVLLPIVIAIFLFFALSVTAKVLVFLLYVDVIPIEANNGCACTSIVPFSEIGSTSKITLFSL
ncbi:hypothetical protein D3C77_534920 [compost metagenome]